MSANAKSGGKNRKYDRCRKRPSNMRYTASKQWEKNKARTAKRIARQDAKRRIRKIMKLPASSRDYGEIQRLRHVISQNLHAAARMGTL